MRINNNLMAANTHRQYKVNNANTSKSVEKLSSGLRINRAGDDAAGLAISEKMRSQIRGLNQASRNAQDGISLIQTAEGGLNETHSMLNRMRELAVQSASDTNGTGDRANIQMEISHLTSEINDIASKTQFNGMKLLNFGGVESAVAVTTATAGAGLGTISGVSANGAVATSVDASSTAGVFARWDVDITSGGTLNVGTGTIEFMGATTTINVVSSGNPQGTWALDTPTSGTETIDDTPQAGYTAVNCYWIFNRLAATYGAASGISDFTFSRTGDQIHIVANTAGDQYNSVALDFSTAAIGITNADVNAPTTLGVDEVAGEYSFTIDTAIEAVGASLTIGGQTFTAVASGAAGDQFNAGSDENAQAQSLVTAINGNAVLSTRFSASATGNAITLTEKAGQVTGVDLTAITLAGNTAALGEYTFDVNSSVAAGGKYTIDGVDIVVTDDAGDAGIAAGTSVLYDAAPNGQAAKLNAAVNANAALSAYTSTASGSTVTLTQTSASITSPVVTTNTNAVVGFNAKLQVGANAGETLNLNIGDMTAAGIGADGLDVSTQTGARAAITAIDSAIAAVSTERANLGALQNRMDHKINNLDTTSENLSAAESRIRDVDMADEMTKFTKNNILVQASTAMLAQANQAPQNVLSLLQ